MVLFASFGTVFQLIVKIKWLATTHLNKDGNMKMLF